MSDSDLNETNTSTKLLVNETEESIYPPTREEDDLCDEEEDDRLVQENLLLT